jgi:hypothetical protein
MRWRRRGLARFFPWGRTPELATPADPGSDPEFGSAPAVTGARASRVAIALPAPRPSHPRPRSARLQSVRCGSGRYAPWLPCARPVSGRQAERRLRPRPPRQLSSDPPAPMPHQRSPHSSRAPTAPEIRCGRAPSSICHRAVQRPHGRAVAMVAIGTSTARLQLRRSERKRAGCEESCRLKCRVGYQIAATIINCRDTCIDSDCLGLEVGVPFIITAISRRNTDIRYPTVKMQPFINLQQLIRITLIVALVIVFPLAAGLRPAYVEQPAHAKISSLVFLELGQGINGEILVHS